MSAEHRDADRAFGVWFLDPRAKVCPEKIWYDLLSGYMLGGMGGFVWFGFQGARHAPRGRRWAGAKRTAKARSPQLAMAFMMWTGLYSGSHCFYLTLRQKSDHLDAILGGFTTGALLSIRGGPKEMFKGGIVGGVLLGVIEFVMESMQPDDLHPFPMERWLVRDGKLEKGTQRTHGVMGQGLIDYDGRDQSDDALYSNYPSSRSLDIHPDNMKFKTIAEERQYRRDYNEYLERFVEEADGYAPDIAAQRMSTRDKVAFHQRVLKETKGKQARVFAAAAEKRPNQKPRSPFSKDDGDDDLPPLPPFWQNPYSHVQRTGYDSYRGYSHMKEYKDQFGITLSSLGFPAAAATPTAAATATRQRRGYTPAASFFVGRLLSFIGQAIPSYTTTPVATIATRDTNYPAWSSVMNNLTRSVNGRWAGLLPKPSPAYT